MSFVEPLIFLFILLFLELIEVAIFSISKGTLNEKAKSSNAIRQCIYLKNNMKDVLVVILILDTVIHNLLGFFLSDFINSFSLGHKYSTVASLIFSFFEIYLIFLVKLFAMNYSAQAIEYFGSIFFYVFKIMRPIGSLFSLMSFANKKYNKESEIISSRNEILASIEELESNTNVKDEAEMLKSVLLLRDITIDQVMTPRQNFVSVEFHPNIEEMKIRLLPHTNFSNIIVWEESEENILGTINLKRFFMDLQINKVSKVIHYLEPPKYLIQTISLYKTLEQIKKTKDRLFFVIEEDGSVVGIVTLSDVLEEITGDLEEDKIEILNDGYVVSGSQNILSLNRSLDIEIPDDCTTVGGFLITLAKRLPKVNDHFQFENIKFKVLTKNSNKIEKVFIKIGPKQQII